MWQASCQPKVISGYYMLQTLNLKQRDAKLEDVTLKAQRDWEVSQPVVATTVLKGEVTSHVIGFVTDGYAERCMFGAYHLRDGRVAVFEVHAPTVVLAVIDFGNGYFWPCDEDTGAAEAALTALEPETGPLKLSSSLSYEDMPGRIIH
jgi:hypothetical protein